MKKVDLANIPKGVGIGANKGKITINWKGSVGHKVKFIYGDIEGYLKIVDYNSKTQLLSIKYMDNPILKIRTGDFIKCKIGGILKRYSKEFKLEIGQTLKDSNRDITITDRSYIPFIKKSGSIENRKHYKYKCNKCGYECGEHYKKKEYKEYHWVSEGNLLGLGNGCACCFNKIVAEGINDITTTAPWMIPYFQGGYDEAKMYTKRSGQRIIPICPDCGRIKDKDGTIDHINKTKSIGCSCGDGMSYPSKVIFSILEQLYIDFKTEFSPKWCIYIDYTDINKIKTGRYDFILDDIYIDNKRVILEIDGGWHKKDNNLSGVKKEESEYTDFTKDNLAKDNGYEVIRIDCYESDIKYIKNSVESSKLNKVLDLYKVDWLKCDEFALNSLVKVACTYWNSGIESTLEISEIMKVSRNTVTKYLKNGTIHKWCNYDAKEQMVKSALQNNPRRQNDIETLEIKEHDYN